MFVVFYSGDRAKKKIVKICDAFGANRYPFTEYLGKQFQMITEACIILMGVGCTIAGIVILTMTYLLFWSYEYEMFTNYHCSYLASG